MAHGITQRQRDNKLHTLLFVHELNEQMLSELTESLTMMGISHLPSSQWTEELVAKFVLCAITVNLLW